MIDDDSIYSIISKHLTGAISEEEKEILGSWLNESDENKEILENFGLHWVNPPECKKKYLKSEEVKNDIWSRLQKAQSQGDGKPRRFIRLLRYAASFLLVALSSIVLYLYCYQNEDISQPEVVLVEKFNQAGRKSTIYLKDGTSVVLNSESGLTYKESFSDSIREVRLSGEAFFDVAKDSSRPFVVLTDEVKVVALGTSFNVNSFLENREVKVSLSSGSVAVCRSSEYLPGNKDQVVLLPGQEVSFGRESSEFSEVRDFDAEKVMAWKNGVLRFDETSMSNVLFELSRWYGVNFEITGKMDLISYTGSFTNQNLDNVLTSIGYVAGFNYDIRDKHVSISFKPKNEYEN